MEMKTKAAVAVLAAVALLAGFFAAGMFAPANTPGEEKAMEKIAQDGKIRACYIVYPPMVSKDPNTGKLSGEMIDAMDYIANESGLEVEYTESTWGTFSAALQAKQCDVVVTGLFSRMERAKTVAFTDPMFYIGNSALIREGDTRFGSIQDFNKPGIRIAVIQGEVGYLYAQKNLPNAELTVLQGADISLALAQVSTGKVDAAFTDGWTIEQYAKEHPETQDFMEVSPASAYGINPVAWAVRQGDTDLLGYLDTSISDLEADGKFLEFEMKYDVHWLREPFELEKS